MKKNRFIFFFVSVLIAVPFCMSCFSTELNQLESPQPPEPVQSSGTHIRTDTELNGSAGVFIEYGLTSDIYILHIIFTPFDS